MQFISFVFLNFALNDQVVQVKYFLELTYI